MDRLARAAVLTRLIRALGEQGSWCGETHVQKAVYFLQDVVRVPLEFEFVLYKYGPYSFDLRDELTGLRADGIVRLDAKNVVGSRIVPTSRSEYIEGKFSRTLQEHGHSVAFVAGKLGNKGVADLERYSTALYVIRRGPTQSVEKQIEDLTQYKPHISRGDAQEAFEAVGSWISEAATAR